MAVVRPFKAIRPTSELASKVAALPYDVMSSEEARQMVVGNPYSFLHVDKAEIDLDPSIDHYSKVVYEKARDNLNKMIADGVYIQDEKPCFYLYKQVMDGRAQVGIVGCASIDDYINNVIKKHELTRADKEEDRVNHVDYCNANTGPIFLTYKARKEINAIVEKTMAKAPVYDFVADGVQNTVWVIDDAQDPIVHAHVGGQAGDNGGVGDADGNGARQGGGGDGGDLDGVGAVHGQTGDVHLVGAAALHGGGVHLGVVDEQPQAGDAGGQGDVQLALIGVAVKAVQAVHGQGIVHIPGPVGEGDLGLPALLGKGGLGHSAGRAPRSAGTA